MAVLGIGNVYGASSNLEYTKFKKNQESAEKTAVTDTFVKDQGTTKDFQSAIRLSGEQIEELRAQHQANFDNLMGQMMGKQARYSSAASSVLSDLPRLAKTPEDAQAAISEDGDWGIKAVATRIMDMAVGLCGGDTSKISILRNAVEKGFSQAKEAWGGELPSICNNTYKEISNRFDYWEANGSLDGYEMAQ